MNGLFTVMRWDCGTDTVKRGSDSRVKGDCHCREMRRVFHGGESPRYQQVHASTGVILPRCNILAGTESCQLTGLKVVPGDCRVHDQASCRCTSNEFSVACMIVVSTNAYNVSQAFPLQTNGHCLAAEMSVSIGQPCDHSFKSYRLLT